MSIVLKVIAEDFIQLAHLETVRPWYAELVEKTRLEPDCIAYDLFVDHKDPGHFIFIELWPDQAALDAHCQSEHFRRLVPLINQFQAAECQFMFMDAFVPDRPHRDIR